MRDVGIDAFPDDLLCLLAKLLAPFLVLLLDGDTLLLEILVHIARVAGKKS